MRGCFAIWRTDLISRSPETRRAILRAIHNGENSDALARFELSTVEEERFRRAASAAEGRAVRQTASVSRYSNLRISSPFTPVPLLVIVIALGCATAVAALLGKADLQEPSTYPLFAATATIAAIAVAAIGWGVAGWVAHRNARVQHTINIVATRFAQPAFVNHLKTFNIQFGDGPHPQVTKAEIDRLVRSTDPKDHDPVQALRYILNYFEFISAGVERGDLDLELIEKNLKGNMSFYYDKCSPYIASLKRDRPLVLEAYTRLRDYFRDV